MTVEMDMEEIVIAGDTAAVEEMLADMADLTAIVVEDTLLVVELVVELLLLNHARMIGLVAAAIPTLPSDVQSMPCAEASWRRRWSPTGGR
uniref:Uncharacterized protein n=1 Tax=Steinernema glaseri TaxID=37863 RepID=A0A1I7YQZ5_9BILA